MKRFNITDISGNRIYLIRWTLFTIPILGWSLKLHKICLPDSDRCEHDHPWWFWQLSIRGGYVETRGDGKRHKVWLPIPRFRPSNFRHRIESLLNDKPAWTLVFCGKNSGTWGFFTNSGWIYWRKFVDMMRETRVAWCEDETIVESDQPA